MFKRVLEGRLPKKNSFFLFGPRQVGKSTLLENIPHVFKLNLLNPESQLTYLKNPSLLSKEILALSQKGAVIIDEIQRVPTLLDVIHDLIEKKTGHFFVMSGSSARKLRHGASNLLGGRALYRTLHPLNLEEIGENYQLEKLLAFGSLPKIHSLVLDNDEVLAKDFLRSYVITYLSEEIKAEALVRNLPDFQRFLDVAAASFSEQINFSDISREAMIGLSTVKEYYSILEDTLMGTILYPFLRSTRKRLSHSPKFYFFDNGVTRALLNTLNAPLNPIEKGRLFEQWVLQELIRLNAYKQLDFKFSFWRTSHGAEVDILIERGRDVIAAIECKSGKNISRKDLSGIFSFQESFKKTPCFVCAMVDQPHKLDNVVVIDPQTLLEKVAKL